MADRPAAVVTVRPFSSVDEGWMQVLLDELFGGRWQARRGELVDVLSAEGLVAVDKDGAGVGFAAYREYDDECELWALAAAPRQRGVGTALLEKLRVHVHGARRIWLVTTNDNLEALRFYQRRGFRLCALRPGAVDEARRLLKPRISQSGAFGIPLRDELELELVLE